MTDWAFTWNGYTFGGVNAAVQVTGAQGLEDSPAVRVTDESRGMNDGEWYGRDYLTGRTVTLDLLFLTGSQGLTFRQVVEPAKAALLPQGGASTASLPLTFTLPGLAARRINCRLRRRSLPVVNGEYPFGYAHGAVEFHAADPRVYDDTAQTATATLAAAATGMSFPVTFPLSFGGATTPSSVTCINQGSTATNPTITIQGPVTTPVVQNATTGQQLRFNLTLAANDLLTVDTDIRSVILNGTASRRSSLSTDSVWWNLPPGPNTITFSAAAATTATAQLVWRNAYL